MLPTKKTVKKTDIRDSTIMLYGLAKIGKTTACSHIDGALFIPTEPGLNNVEVYATEQPENWLHFLEIAAEIASDSKQFKTIIIDVFDNLYRLCADNYCQKIGVDHETDIPYGKGTPIIVNEVLRVIYKLARLKTGLVLVSHCAEQEMETRTGVTVKKVPSFSKGVYGSKVSASYHTHVTGLVDAILFATVDRDDSGNITRTVRSLPSGEYEAGDRTGIFKDGMLLSDLFKKKGGK